MEHLFSTHIDANDRNIKYRVVFDGGNYVFVSEVDNSEFPSFSFSREHDAWLGGDALPTGLKDQAIAALERYLLKQH
jgi:hypothetical protein